MSLFISEVGGNANINLLKLGERFVAMTETPMAVEFDPVTLETKGLFNYEGDGVAGQLTSAHPIPHEDGVYNFTVAMGASSRYCAYRIEPGQVGRIVLATHPVREPAYLHSCGLSSSHLILVEGPLVVIPLDLLWRDKPYIECYRWEPSRGTGIVLLDRKNGTSRRVEGPPMFVFHHVNAFDEGRDICVDVLAYEDPGIIKALYLNELERGGVVPMPLLKRLRIGIGETFTVQTLSQVPLELPRILPKDQGVAYRDVWGVTRVEGNFYDGLARLDALDGSSTVWSSKGCYAGEPVPVSGPDGEAVILSAVLDSEKKQSFLLCLDAQTMKERARAYVPAVVPFGFHGGFYRG
jgi:beta,beta-carotene 9',10'-dioxygenase